MQEPLVEETRECIVHFLFLHFCYISHIIRCDDSQITKKYRLVESYSRSVNFVCRFIRASFAIHFLLGKQWIVLLLLLLLPLSPPKTTSTMMEMLAMLFYYCIFIFRSNPRSKGAIHSITVINACINNMPAQARIQTHMTVHSVH